MCNQPFLVSTTTNAEQSPAFWQCVQLGISLGDVLAEVANCVPRQLNIGHSVRPEAVGASRPPDLRVWPGDAESFGDPQQDVIVRAAFSGEFKHPLVPQSNPMSAAVSLDPTDKPPDLLRRPPFRAAVREGDEDDIPGASTWGRSNSSSS
jgi:hypothetical protein